MTLPNLIPTPSPNNIALDRFYCNMVNESLECGQFPKGMTCGVIPLLFKQGNRMRLANWRPIILLNATYKIFVKALKRYLQRFWEEVTDNDQTAILPLHVFWDNTCLRMNQYSLK